MRQDRMEEISEALSKIDSLRIKVGANPKAQKNLSQARDALMDEAMSIKQAGIFPIIDSL